MIADPLSLAEASIVTGLKEKAIRKAIENDVVRASRAAAGPFAGRLSVPLRELVALRLEKDLAPVQLETRRKMIREITARGLKGDFRRDPDGSLTVDIALARSKVANGLWRLRAARSIAVTDPGIMNGQAVFRGTRIPVHVIAAMIEAGEAIAAIQAAYPGLSRKQIELAPVYARSHPLRGRPARQPWHAGGPTRVRRIRIDDVA